MITFEDGDFVARIKLIGQGEAPARRAGSLQCMSSVIAVLRNSGNSHQTEQSNFFH